MEAYFIYLSSPSLPLFILSIFTIPSILSLLLHPLPHPPSSSIFSLIILTTLITTIPSTLFILSEEVEGVRGMVAKAGGEEREHEQKLDEVLGIKVDKMDKVGQLVLHGC